MSAAAGDNGGEPPKPVDACPYLEGQLPFDPNKVLLRRVFFLDPEKTKYISVGFYPARNYQPIVEIGSPKSTPIVLTDQHVKTLCEHLPAQIDALWRGFLQRGGWRICHALGIPFNTAILTMGKLNDLRYLAYIFPMVEDQLLKYTEAMPDVMNYVLATLNSTSSVEPPADARNNILYYHLYEELKTLS